MIRFEILLPLFSNDGQPIERRKFLETDDELVRSFGATSTDTVVVRGQWLYRSDSTRLIFGSPLIEWTFSDLADFRFRTSPGQHRYPR